MIHFLVHDARDKVGVAVVDIAAGTDCSGKILSNNKPLKATAAAADIPLGHKLALKDLAVGDTVIKYGWTSARSCSRSRPGNSCTFIT